MPVDPRILGGLRPGAPLREPELRAFLELRQPEGLRVEYKRELPKGDGVIRSIAAMANTAGGAVLVGVASDPETHVPLPDPTGVSLADRDSLVRQAYALLDPYGALDIEPVELAESGRYVLVVHVDERTADTPVVVSGRVYVRLEGQTVPATRSQILALAARVAQPGGRFPMVSRRPDARRGAFPLADADAPGLAARLVLEAQLPRWGRFARLGSDARAAFARAVGTSRLEAWLSENADYSPLPAEWRRDGRWMTSTVCFIRRERRRTVTGGWEVEAQAGIELRTYAGGGGLLTLYLDAAFVPERPGPQEGPATPEPSASSPPYRLTIRALYEFVNALVVAAMDVASSPAFDLLLDTDLLPEFGGPAVEISTAPEPLERFIVFDPYPRADEARSQQAVALDLSGERNLLEPDARRRALIDWLEVVYLNHGYEDFEPALDALGR